MTIDHSATLHRLLYTSQARFTCTEKLIGAEIDLIVQHAARLNDERGISGILLYIHGTFIQVLEGPLSAIETVFEAICGDLRHGSMKLVEMTAVDQRVFADRPMAYVGFDDDPARLKVNRVLKEIALTVENDPKRALHLMEDLPV